jgi:hypothetical protein
MVSPQGVEVIQAFRRSPGIACMIVRDTRLHFKLIEEACTGIRDGVAFSTHVPERNRAASAIALQQSSSNDSLMPVSAERRRAPAISRDAAAA